MTKAIVNIKKVHRMTLFLMLAISLDPFKKGNAQYYLYMEEQYNHDY